MQFKFFRLEKKKKLIINRITTKLFVVKSQDMDMVSFFYSIRILVFIFNFAIYLVLFAYYRKEW